MTVLQPDVEKPTPLTEVCKNNGQIDTNPSDLDNGISTDESNNYVLTPLLVALQRIDPMIGMNGVTPQMFMTKEK